jgi:predicted acetyltransferase
LRTNQLSFALASSEGDIDSAFQLAISVFKVSSDIDDYDFYKLRLWRDDPSYALDNFILARAEDGDVCGLVRIVPRTIFRGEEAFSVAGVSSVCLAPRQRGNGNSLKLMEFALACCKKRAFDFAFLFARRAADHYYSRFGFQGISSYSKLKIKYADLASDSQLVAGPSCEQNIKIYSAAYDQCYARVFGRVERTPAYWQFLLRKFQSPYPDRIETLYISGEPVGYVLLNDSTIHELAFTQHVDARALIAFLSRQFPLVCKDGDINLDLPPQHSLLSALHGLDISVTQRECPFGGHMACILNPEALLQRVSKRSPQRAAELASLRSLKHFNHYETCCLLGVATISAREVSTDTLLPYNMSAADHF